MYSTEVEHDLRRQIFIENRDMIIRHNKLYEKGLVSFEMGLNRYSDLTRREFVAQMNGFEMSSDLK